jgi:hypothetical protein
MIDLDRCYGKHDGMKRNWGMFLWSRARPESGKNVADEATRIVVGKSIGFFQKIFARVFR